MQSNFLIKLKTILINTNAEYNCWCMVWEAKQKTIKRNILNNICCLFCSKHSINNSLLKIPVILSCFASQSFRSVVLNLFLSLRAGKLWKQLLPTGKCSKSSKNVFTAKVCISKVKTFENIFILTISLKENQMKHFWRFFFSSPQTV